MHLTIVGLDGVGKSSLMKNFCIKGISYISSPSFQEGDENPYNELSKDLEELSEIADSKKNVALKSILMILQTSLFSKIEKFHYKSCTDIISLRHPLIDILVYSQIYLKLLDFSNIDDLLTESQFNEFFLNKKNAKDYYLSFSNLHKTTSYIQILHIFKKALTLSRADALKEVAKLLEIELPKKCLFLDLDPKVAIERLRKNKINELHENISDLESLRAAYFNVLDEISHLNQSFEYLVIDMEKTSVMEIQDKIKKCYIL